MEICTNCATHTARFPMLSRWIGGRGMLNPGHLSSSQYLTFLNSRRRVRRLLHQKEEYDELMDKLQREAYLQLVMMERLEAERQAEREARERRRKQQLLHRKKRMLEAAFEGDLDEIRKVRCIMLVRNISLRQLGETELRLYLHKLLVCACVCCGLWTCQYLFL